MIGTMSFSRELLNEPREDTSPEKKETMKEMSTGSTQKQTDQKPNAVFNSVDFGKFLSKEYPKSFDSSSPFLSKENAVASLGSVFKSKDAFSKLFSSSEWGMDLTKNPQKPPSRGGSDSKKLAKVLSSKDWMPLQTLGSHVDVSYSQNMFNGSDSETSSDKKTKEDAKKSLAKVLSSRDWTKTLGSHVDVAYSGNIFATSDSEKSFPEVPTEVASAAELPPAKTDWENMFLSQLQLVPPPPEDAVDEETNMDIVEENVPSTSNEAAAVAETPAPKKKRKRKPRKKVVPEVKVYVEPTDVDVLLGRGGRSNHHPGNKRYREEVKNLHKWYLGIEDKDEKTDLSQCLVDYVHSYEGRFLEKDSNGWFLVPNIVARRKASQALREDNDPTKRAQKRKRYLEKKAKVEAEKTG
jgi:hypothetical protein